MAVARRVFLVAADTGAGQASGDFLHRERHGAMIRMVARVETLVEFGDVKGQRGARCAFTGDDRFEGRDEIAPTGVPRAVVDGFRLDGRAQTQSLKRQRVFLKDVAGDDVAVMDAQEIRDGIGVGVARHLVACAIDGLGLAVRAQRGGGIGGVGHEANGAQRTFLARKVVRRRSAAQHFAGVAGRHVHEHGFLMRLVHGVKGIGVHEELPVIGMRDHEDAERGCWRWRRGRLARKVCAAGDR